MKNKAKQLCMIIRGPKSEFHKAPYHPIIIVTRKHTYQWEVGKCNEGATAVSFSIDTDFENPHFLLERYKGYINDSNCHFTLFDGVDTQEFLKSDYLKECLSKAIWWSDQIPPELLNVNFANDDFTKDKIICDSGTCLLTNSKEEKFKESLEKYPLPIWLEKSGN